MPSYILTEPAPDDIREIVDYLRERSPQAARNVRGKLRDAMRKLARFPGMGHTREDLADETLRVWSVYSYLISISRHLDPSRLCAYCTVCVMFPRYCMARDERLIF